MIGERASNPSPKLPPTESKCGFTRMNPHFSKLAAVPVTPGQPLSQLVNVAYVDDKA